jgi:hypothetical protein
MISNFTGILRKKSALALFCCVSLLFAQSLLANWTLDMVSGSVLPNGNFLEGKYVKGVSTKAGVQLYITTDENPLRLMSILVSLPDADKSKWDSMVWSEDLVDEDGKSYGNTPGTGAPKIQPKVDAGVGLTAVQDNVKRQYLGTVYYTVDEGIKTVQTTAEINTAGTPSGKNYKELTALTGPSTISLVDSFNFSVKGGFEMAEDQEGGLTIGATDEQFECTAWNGTDVVSSSEVEFSDASLAEGSASAGTVTVEKGQILFTPAENFNGGVTINATAKSTNADLTEAAPVDVEVKITVTPVDDPAELYVYGTPALNFVEGKKVSETEGLELWFYEKEVDAGEVNLAENATLGLLNANNTFAYQLAVKLVQTTPEGVTPEDGQVYYKVDFSGCDTEIAYTSVYHPNTSKDFPAKLFVIDGGAMQQEAFLETTAKVTDTDRLPVINSVNVASISGKLDGADGKYTIQADSQFEITAEVTDADEEDETTYNVAYKDSDDTEASAPWKKGAKLKPVVTATSNGQNVVYEGTLELSVINSAPVVSAPSGRIFILRGGSNYTGTTTVTLSDADGAADLVIPEKAALEVKDALGVLTGEVSITSVAKDGDANALVVTLSYTVPEDLRASENDLSGTAIITFADKENKQVSYALTIDYKENPVPVVVLKESSLAINEVDEDGVAKVFTVEATATDQDVYPAGVKSWNITVPEGWTYEVVETTGIGTVDSGVATSTAKWTVTTAGYDTIANGDDDQRTKTLASQVKVTAVDAATDGEGSAELTVTVTDVDRAPSAPATVDTTPEEPVHGSTLVATAQGATDEDSDTITYEYAWSYSADGTDFTAIDGEGEVGNQLSAADAIKKGYTVKVAAKTKTTPYSDVDLVVTSENATEATWIIGNTAPYFFYVGDSQATEPTEAPAVEEAITYEWTVAEDSEASTRYVAAYDVDVVDGVDTLTYSLAEELDEAIGTASIDETTGAITFQPAEDYFNDGTDMPVLTIQVADESEAGATNTLTISLKVTSVNDIPVVKAEDQYVLPDERGTKMTATLKVSLGVGEDDQELTEANITEVTDEDAIFDDTPAIAVSGDQVTLTYTVKADAELGKSASITFTVTDNGTTDGVADPKTSEAATITVFVGASPWYPIVSFTCTDPENHTDGHTFVLSAEGEETLSITVTEEGRTQLLPKDYYEQGFEGYKGETDIDVSIYVWSRSSGTTDELCAEREISVSEYGLPGTASSDTESLTADENGYVTLPDISVPMASSYELEVVNEDGEVVQTIGPVDFEPSENGMILPNITGRELQISEAGKYTLAVTGTNPEGEGQKTDVLTIEVPESSEAVLEWGESPAFAPASGKVLTSGSVKFVWPVATNATSYQLRVYGADGSQVAEVSDINGNNAVVELEISEEPTSYSWYVTATNGKKSITSDTLQFTLAETTETPIVTGVYTELTDGDSTGNLVLATEGAVAEDATITFDAQYFSIPEMKWFYVYKGTATITDGRIVLDMQGAPTAADDYVALKLYANGKETGDYVVYLVQDGGSLQRD